MLFTRAKSNSEISRRDVALNFSPTGNITPTKRVLCDNFMLILIRCRLHLQWMFNLVNFVY